MTKKILCFSAILAAISFADFALAKAPAKPEIPPAFVEVAVVAETTDQQKVFSTGSITANPGAVIKSETAGRITKITFNPGQKVAAGTPLIEIYPDIIKAQLAQSLADLKLKQLNYERNLKLLGSHTISKSEFDQAQDDLDSAKARVDQNNALLRQNLIAAPFAGRLGINLINVGDYVSVGQELVSLQALDPIYVDFSVPEIYSHQVAVNQPISLTTDANPGKVFDGSVFAIDPLIDTKTRSLRIRALVPNKEEKLLPGTFAEVTLMIGSQQPAIKIPQTAIVAEANGNYVYRVVDNKAVKTPVVTGARDAQNIVIKSGLKVGDTIVTAGQLKIFMDGAPVIFAGSNQNPAAQNGNKAPQSQNNKGTK